MKLVDELDMDSASEFLQMAATLLEIKSRAMLPKPPKPEDENELSPERLIKELFALTADTALRKNLMNYPIKSGNRRIEAEIERIAIHGAV